MKPKKLAGENKRLKAIGLSVLLIPTLFFLIFLVGETVGGDISGISHILQIIPIIVLGIIGLKYPYIGGLILTIIGTILFILYAISAELQSLFLGLIIFLPLIISGILLILSARR
ncbi:hypothetical protein KKC60_00585 [Patescibacteria group bacterium]|nr:hypothetical protein [Patescibacteria group bacterium]